MIWISILLFIPSILSAQYSQDFLKELSFGSAEKISQMIINQQININQIDTNSGYTPLMIALKNGQYQIAIELLEKHNANPNIITQDKETALTIASYYDQWRAINPLISYNANLHYTNQNGNALHYSAQHGLSKTVPTLIKAGININLTNELEQTPLMLAAKNGFLHTVKYLLKNQAVLDSTDNMGYSALSYAVKNNHLKTAKFLLKQGASIEVTNLKGDTLIILAAKNGSKDILKMLIKNNENIHSANNNGDTAILIATKNNELSSFNILLKAGANLSTTNINNETPYKIASKYEYIEILEVIKKHFKTNSLTN